jgi:hypothetical protein
MEPDRNVPYFYKLAPVDQHTICNVLHIPTPTPDVTLDMILTQEKIHPSDVLVRLERCRDLRAMMAAAALRGRVQTLPADPRLSPKPYPKAPVRTPKTAAEQTRTAEPAPRSRPNSTRVLVSFQPNPKRPGSEARDRYNRYKIGLTEVQLLERGLWRSDFRHDTQRGFITWST